MIYTLFASYTNHVCQTCNIIAPLQWDFTLYFTTNQNHFNKTTQTKGLSLWSVHIFSQAESGDDATLLICSLPIWTAQTVKY